MNKLKQKVASVGLALGILGAGAVVAAPSAQAYNSWFSETIRCDYIDTYYNVDYDWWEEVFQGKRDYRTYVGTRYQYNWACHQTWNF